MEEVTEPLVSLIAVCYNHKDFIKDCISSMVRQSYKNTEIIVYDNASTDGSIEILKSFQNTYKFKLICQENIGQSRTCNKAIVLAKGKYVSFLSTDDYWPLDKIEIAVNFLENSDEQIAVCGGSAIRIDKSGKIFRKQIFADYHELEFHDVFVDGNIIPAVTSVIRKSALINVGGFDEKQTGEDTPMWLRLTFNGYRIAYLNKLLGYYRHHDTNFSHQRDNIINVIKMIYGDYSDHKDYEEALSNKFFRTFSRYSKIDKIYSFKFLKYVKFKYLSIKDILNASVFLILPYKFIRRITRVI